jgi:hypothetical protein
MPGSNETGMLEDLCLRTVAAHRAMACVMEFEDCVGHLTPRPKVLIKAKAQVFLAAMSEIVNSVGLGAQNGYWNFNSTELDELKTFLKELR